MDSNLPKANNMLIELELETWLLATEWLILKFSNGPLEKRTTHFFLGHGNGNGNGNGVTVTKQVDVIGLLVRILVP